MARRIHIMVASAVLAVSATGCASGLQTRLDQQQATLESMQSRMDQLMQNEQSQSQELAALRRDTMQAGTRTTALEEQVADLANRTENLSTRLSLLTDDVARLKGPGTTMQTPPASGGAIRFTEGPVPPSAGVQGTYDGARRLYEAGQPREAIAEFARVIQMAPQSDLADNAEYWTGECYYKLEEFDQALAAFKKVFDYSHTDKYDDAQLKIGMTYRLMGQRDSAITALRKLISKYPDSEYVSYARRILSELGG